MTINLTNLFKDLCNLEEELKETKSDLSLFLFIFDIKVRKFLKSKAVTSADFLLALHVPLKPLKYIVSLCEENPFFFEATLITKVFVLYTNIDQICEDLSSKQSISEEMVYCNVR